VSEAVLYKDSPAMFRNRPILFLICCVLVPFGIGLLILIVWWLKCWQTSVVVTNDRVTLRKGILSKYTSDILISDIRNVQVAQSFVQRILGVGRVTVSTTGQADMEIDVNGLPHPERIQSIINKIRAASRKS